MLISPRFAKHSLQSKAVFRSSRPWLWIEPGLEMGQNLKAEDAKISLTFDDGPDPKWTPRVLEELGRTGARATFFVVTPKARQHPRLISEIQLAGHRVEFHCVEHVRHTERTRSEVERDTRSGLGDLIALGVEPELWRTPWGITEPWTYEIAERFGLQIAPWTADTHDWRGDTAAEMLRATEPVLGAGATILMHDGLGPGALRDNCEETAALISPLVRRIRALGCEPSAMETEWEPAST